MVLLVKLTSFVMLIFVFIPLNREVTYKFNTRPSNRRIITYVRLKTTVDFINKVKLHRRRINVHVNPTQCIRIRIIL